MTRARIVAEALPHHEFLFVGGGAARELRHLGSVEDVPMLATHYAAQRVDAVRTVTEALRALALSPRTLQRTARRIRSFDPDLVLTDFEPWTAAAARLVGWHVVGLSHQHVVTRCRYPGPPGHRLSALLSRTLMRVFHGGAHHYLISSFFEATPRDPRSTELYGPLLRPEILAAKPTTGEHVLVYQTSPTFGSLLPALEAAGRPCRIYGMGERSGTGAIRFEAPSSSAFAADMASCAYVICNGSHGVISEALALGKPVLAFPIGLIYEQLVNAHNLALADYGDLSLSRAPTPQVLADFEKRHPLYRERIGGCRSPGNASVLARLEEFVDQGWSRGGQRR